MKRKELLDSVEANIITAIEGQALIGDALVQTCIFLVLSDLRDSVQKCASFLSILAANMPLENQGVNLIAQLGRLTDRMCACLESIDRHLPMS